MPPLLPARIFDVDAILRRWRTQSFNYMDNEQSLGKIVSLESVKDVERALTQMENRFLSVCSWINSNCQRSDQSIALVNLLSSSAQYIRVASDNLEGHISVCALATRSLYELNVRTRAVLSAHDNMLSWLSEALTDKIQTLEGFMALNTVRDMTVEHSVLRAEIDRLNALRGKYKLPTVKKPEDAGAIAPKVGLANEHKALFKLFSKLVHPSSYLTNDYGNAASKEVRAILQMHAQLYAWDTFGRICDAQSVPQEIREANIEIARRV